MVLFALSAVGLAATNHDHDAYAVALTVAFPVSNLIGLAVSTRAGFQRGIDSASRRPWRRLALAWVFLTLAGGAFGAASTHGPTEPTLKLIGNCCWFAVTVCTLLALLAFPMRPMSRRERRQFLLDMATVLGGGFMLAWYLIIGPSLSNASDAADLVGVGLPVSYLALLFAVCAVMVRGGVTASRHPLPVLLAGLICYLITESVISYLAIGGAVSDEAIGIHLPLLAGAYLTITAAAVQVRRAKTAEPAASLPESGRPTRLPYVALAIGYGLLVVAAWDAGLHPWGGLVAGAVTMTGAVAVRQLIALRENQNLLAQDTLTGLASRRHFHDTLHRLTDNERSVRSAALLIDLDGFKQVNDTLGHAAGDALLIGFADTLRRSVRPGDIAGRLGGDEFAIILPDVTGEAAALAVADRILASCEMPLLIAGAEVYARASIGVAVTTPDHPLTAHELLHRADVAMYHAKRAGGHDAETYDPDMELTPAPAPGPAAVPALTPGELAELDRLRARVAELERRGRPREASFTDR